MEMGMKLRKAKLEISSFCGGAGREDIAQGLFNLTFRNQIIIKLDEYKNLEIPTVAYNGMPSSYMVKIDQSIWVLKNRWHLQMVPDLIAATPLLRVLVYHSLLNRDPVEEFWIYWTEVTYISKCDELILSHEMKLYLVPF